MMWSAAILFALCAGGLAHTLLRAFHSGAEAYSGAYSADTAREFEDVFLFIPPRRIAELGWACATAAFLLVFFAAGNMRNLQGMLLGGLCGGVAGALALRAPRLALGFLKKRRLHRFNLQLVDALVAMSNALKAGFSIAQAFEAVVKTGENPIAQEFDVFLQQTRVGVNFSEALQNLDKRVGSQDLTLMITAIETARRSGGNLTEVFETIAATIRERIRIENRIRTLTAQGRLQGIVVGSMPVVILLALFAVRPAMMHGFVHSMMGLTIIGAVVLLVFFGGLLIRKIVNIDV